VFSKRQQKMTICIIIKKSDSLTVTEIKLWKLLRKCLSHSCQHPLFRIKLCQQYVKISKVY